MKLGVTVAARCLKELQLPGAPEGVDAAATGSRPGRSLVPASTTTERNVLTLMRQSSLNQRLRVPAWAVPGMRGISESVSGVCQRGNHQTKSVK